MITLAHKAPAKSVAGVMLRYLRAVCICLITTSVGVAAEPIPNSLDQAFTYLDKKLPSKERESFMLTPERTAVVRAHDGLGMFIRNEWFRSGKSKLVDLLQKAGAESMDDMSSMVLTSYWRRLNGKPIELEKQGECFSRWWAKEERLEKEARAKGKDTYSTPDISCP